MTVKEMREQLAEALASVFQSVPKGKRASLFPHMCCIESWANRGIAAAQVAEDEAKKGDDDGR